MGNANSFEDTENQDTKIREEILTQNIRQKEREIFVEPTFHSYFDIVQRNPMIFMAPFLFGCAVGGNCLKNFKFTVDNSLKGREVLFIH